MSEKESPIFHFYPSEFKTDLNGKKQEWEALVLIPFIDEVILISITEAYVYKHRNVNA
jgi:5'-3' exoribonuclease 1